MVNTVDKQRFRHVGLVAKGQEPSIADDLHRIAKKLAASNCTVTYDKVAATLLQSSEKGLGRKDLAASVDVIVILGGDGTLLSIAPICPRSRTRRQLWQSRLLDLKCPRRKRYCYSESSRRRLHQ